MARILLSLLRWCDMGGKSSGDDNGAAEQQRIKAEQDKAIARLNSLFGVADPTQLVDRNSFVSPEYFELQQAAAARGGTVEGDGSEFDQQGYDAALQKAKAENDLIKSARNAMYQRVGDDVFNAKIPTLKKQYENAGSDLAINLARSGQRGGSLAVMQNSELDTNYNRGLTDLANLRQSTINNAKAADESSRLDLIGRIRAGMNQADAVNSASEQQRSNLAKAQDNALAQTVTDYFSGMKYLQQQDQYQKDLNAGLKRFNVNPASYSGTIGRL